MNDLHTVQGKETFYWWSSGLSTKEILELFKYRILTPKTHYKEQYAYLIPSGTTLLFSEQVDLKIGFIGDLMPINRKPVFLSDDLKSLLSTLDVLVINLEGVITTKKRFLAQVHHLEIIETIQSLFSGRLLINVANNHSGDFGVSEFYSHLNHLHTAGLPTFGYKEQPHFEFEKFRLYPSSLWSNQKFNIINRFDYDAHEHTKQFLSQSHFNIFLPHWGYEMQLYPIKKHQNSAYRFLNDWDMIIGNHTHCPQPAELIPFESEHRLIAFSLGNFCYDIFNSNQWHGAMVIAGFSCSGLKPKLVSCTYHFTHQENPKKEIRIKLCNELNYLKRRLDMLDYLKW